MEEIFNIALTNGIFAALFVVLFFYSLKDSNNREKKYQATIDNLYQHLKKIDDIKNDTGSIKAIVIKANGIKPKEVKDEKNY